MTCCVAQHTDPHDPRTPGACTRALLALTARTNQRSHRERTNERNTR